MIVVVRRDFVFLPNAPSKKLLVKPARAILIGRAQVSDTECTGKAFNAEATAGPRLPQGEDGSDRVLNTAMRPRLYTSRGSAITFAPSPVARLAAVSAFSTAT